MDLKRCQTADESVRFLFCNYHRWQAVVLSLVTLPSILASYMTIIIIIFPSQETYSPDLYASTDERNQIVKPTLEQYKEKDQIEKPSLEQPSNTTTGKKTPTPTKVSETAEKPKRKTTEKTNSIGKNVEMIEAFASFRTNAPVDTVSLSGDGKSVLILSKAKMVSIFDIRTNKQIDGSIAVSQVQLSPNGTKFIGRYHQDKNRSAKQGQGWGLFDARDGSLIAPLPGVTCHTLHFSQTGNLIYGGKYQSNRYRYSSACITDIRRSQDGKPLPFWDEEGSDNVRSQRRSGSGYKRGRMLIGTFDSDKRFLNWHQDSNSVSVGTISEDELRTDHTITFPSTIFDVTLSTESRLAVVFLKEARKAVVLSLPNLDTIYSVYSEHDSFQNVPRFSQDGKSLLVRIGVTNNYFELLDAQTGKSKFQFGLQQYITNSVYLESKGRLGYSQNIYSVETGEVIDYAPFKAHYGFWSKNSFSTSRDDFLFWIRNQITVEDTQGLYFIDILNKTTKNLLLPDGVACLDFESSKNGSRIAAACSDGVARIWQTRP